MKTKRLVDLENQNYEEETDSETEALQEAFAKGFLKPGLNIPVVEKKHVNNVVSLKQKLDELRNNLNWIEKLDLISEKAPLPPELAVQMSDELNSKQSFTYNELKHESLFYRQAQDAVLKGIPKLHELGIDTKRPEDYFAEMAKSDEHMQKVKAELIKKKSVMERREKVRAIRTQKKLQKMLRAQSKVEKQEAKKKFVEEVKKFRKGQRKDLGFLDNKPAKRGQQKGNQSQLKRNFKNSKFGFGGKKRGLKKNTRESTNDMSSGGAKKKRRTGGGQGRPPARTKTTKAKAGKSKPARPGKNRRKNIKSKGK